jgi:hypothetical protein
VETTRDEQKRYYIFFRGTNNGEIIFASTMPQAKAAFAAKHGLPANSAYITGRYVKFVRASEVQS